MANTIKITREFIYEAVMKSLERVLREGIMEEKDSDDDDENDEQKGVRRSVLQFLREPGRDLAIYAYRMEGIDPEDVDSHDDNELGGIRSAFYKKVDEYRDEKTGYIHHFSTQEINDLKNMIDSETNGK